MMLSKCLVGSSKRFLRASVFGLAGFVGCCGLAGVAYGSFSNSNLFLGADNQFQIRVQGAFSDRVNVVYDNFSLQDFAKSLESRTGIRIRVEAACATRIVDAISDNQRIDTLLEQVTAQTQTFLVYRDGYLLFSENAIFNLGLSRELDQSELIKLSDVFYKGQSTALVGRTTMQLTATRSGYRQLWDFFSAEKLHVEVSSTDATIFAGIN